MRRGRAAGGVVKDLKAFPILDRLVHHFGDAPVEPRDELRFSGSEEHSQARPVRCDHVASGRRIDDGRGREPGPRELDELATFAGIEHVGQEGDRRPLTPRDHPETIKTIKTSEGAVGAGLPTWSASGRAVSSYGKRIAIADVGCTAHGGDYL